MKLAFVLIAFLSNAVHAQSKCAADAAKLLSGGVEQRIFKNHPAMHTFIDCESPVLGMDVVIHEAAHLDELGVPAGMSVEAIEKWMSNPRNFKFNLLSLDGSKKGEMKLVGLPAPKELISKFLKVQHPTVIADDEHTLQSLVEMYLDDEGALSSTSFTKGLVSELSAYTHGMALEMRTRVNGGSQQRYGVYGFLFFFKAYLAQLKVDHPSIWKKLNTKANRTYLRHLFKQAGDVLVRSNHCATMDEFERRDLYGLFAAPNGKDALDVILENESSVYCK